MNSLLAKLSFFELQRHSYMAGDIANSLIDQIMCSIHVLVY